MLIQDKKIISNESAKNHTIDKNKQTAELICNSYRNHPSILKVKTNITTKGNINDNRIFSPVGSVEVPVLIKFLLF